MFVSSNSENQTSCRRNVVRLVEEPEEVLKAAGVMFVHYLTELRTSEDIVEIVQHSTEFEDSRLTMLLTYLLGRLATECCAVTMPSTR